MRKLVIVLGLAAMGMTSACAHGGLNRTRPDEFAVTRAAPLVIPPEFALVPPRPGAVRPQDTSPADQALDAMFGGTAVRSASENAMLDAAGREQADDGIRSAAGSPATDVTDKGQTTRDIVAAPAGNGQDATTNTPQN